MKTTTAIRFLALTAVAGFCASLNLNAAAQQMPTVIRATGGVVTTSGGSTPTAAPTAAPTTQQAAAVTSAPFVLSLSTGFQKVLNLPAVPARVSIGDPNIISVNVLKPTDKDRKSAGVLVTGLKTGSTSLLIWDKGASTPRVITVSVTGKAAETISSIKGLDLKTQGQVLTLSGSTPDVRTYQQARESLTRTTQGQAPAELIDQATLQTSGTVQVDVKVVEFTRSELQRLGINITGQMRGGGFTYGIASPSASGAGNVSNAFSLAFNGGGCIGNAALGSVSTALLPGSNVPVGPLTCDLLSGLNILQSDGYAKVLAEPSLIAQSGQDASFLAGGEIPIPVPSGNGTIGIEYKKFGIGLTFRPTILSNKTIALNVSPEVSDLDFSRGTSIQGILVPAILTRRANTTVELGENQSFVIGGLISRNIIANASKVPWLAEIPILGAFFKGNSYSREDKELLIIVTPRFVKPRAADAPKLPLPGENVGMRPRSVWSQLFLPSAGEPVPGFSTK
ncbi:pilus assembly protein N-terminal domain-containing protein [Limnobacter humi]|uniref:Pilus assembly protein N-terminal domain-containing protein n=1 Tax=Limnobacter humi TaxID=1778671 RepID=A0ABT1WBN8_9BURK|nr:pilus assembly protein N-terminal domain-containing protein [Limnobacter humi]MCQ8894928.1 pilus assembly protein N-terminal domain-containing protein [Limnobacter humi]